MEDRETSGTRLTAQEKLKLVLGSYQADNIADYCRVSKIDRSYLYQLRRELQDIALEGWDGRRPGRPPKAADNLDVVRAELDQTRDLLAQARDDATQWEIRSELQGYYLQVAEDGQKKTGALPNRAARRRARRSNG